MNEQKIRQNIRKLLFEDNWVALATDDKAAGKFAVADEETPIKADPQMAVQLTTIEPPVNDEEYKPTNSTDLSHALSVLFKDTPDDQIEYVYRQAHRLRAFAEEKSRNFRVADPAIDNTIPLDKPVRKSTKVPEKFKKSEE